MRGAREKKDVRGSKAFGHRQAAKVIGDGRFQRHSSHHTKPRAYFRASRPMCAKKSGERERSWITSKECPACSSLGVQDLSCRNIRSTSYVGRELSRTAVAKVKGARHSVTSSERRRFHSLSCCCDWLRNEQRRPLLECATLVNSSPEQERDTCLQGVTQRTSPPPI